LLLALGCAGPSRAVRTAIARADIAGALRSYDAFVEARGDGDADLLADIALAALRRLASSRDPGERNAGFSALRSVGVHGNDVLDALARVEGVVGDRAAAVRWEVGGREGPAPARLQEALRSDERERRVAGMTALRPPRSRRRLLRLLDDGDAVIRAAAAQRLGSAHDEDVTARLLTMLRDDTSDDVRAACAGSLGGRGEEVLDALTAALEDRSHFVRMMAPAALAATSLEQARARLAPLFARDRSALSIEAARALAARGDADAQRYLLDALRSPRADHRAQASVAAPYLVSAHGPALVEALGGDDLEVTLRVATALSRAEPHREAALGALRRLGASPEGFVAVRALQSLAARGDPGAAEGIRQALASPDVSVRRVAAMAWGDVAGPSGDCDVLAPLLRDADRSVVALAAMQIILVAAR
jgi:HEAT repeat protein